MKETNIYFLSHYTTYLHLSEAASMVKTAWEKVAPLYYGTENVFATVTHTQFPISTEEFGTFAPDHAGWSAYQDMTQEKFRYYDGPFFRTVSVLLKDMFYCDLMVSKWVMRGDKVYYVTFFGIETNVFRPTTVANEYDDQFYVPEPEEVKDWMPDRLAKWFAEYRTNPTSVSVIKLPSREVSREELREVWAYSQIGHPGSYDGTVHVERDPLGFDKRKLPGIIVSLRELFFGKAEKNK